MRRGPKGNSKETQRAKGETRPSRKVEVLFPDIASRPDPDELPPPKWLSAAAKKIWIRKVDRYRQRSQKIDGFQDTLGQYCALEAELERRWKTAGLDATMSMVTQHRMWASEFFDTPASQRISPSGSGRKDNPFSGHGRQEHGA